MVPAVCNRVVVVQEPMIRVTSAQSLTLEAKGSDTSLRLAFMVTNGNYPLMYYFLRFFKLRTAHRVSGTLYVSAYTFDDSVRAFACIRVGVQAIAPIREVDFQGNISGFGPDQGCIPITEGNAPLNREYVKLKFIFFKYVWENWNNETLSVKDYLEGLYDDLVELDKAVPNANPVFMEQRRVRDARGARANRRGTVQVRVYNPSVTPTDLSSASLSLPVLLDDDTPFDDSVFVNGDVGTPAPAPSSGFGQMMD
ncbi:hypothetical protein EDC96DRAFT_532143 [Choanephora cucurbitarum]|nr:hypothetical protein EDC96DRAFT_532143 [Choanephora cucurbitarum]